MVGRGKENARDAYIVEGDPMANVPHTQGDVRFNDVFCATTAVLVVSRSSWFHFLGPKTQDSHSLQLFAIYIKARFFSCRAGVTMLRPPCTYPAAPRVQRVSLHPGYTIDSNH